MWEYIRAHNLQVRCVYLSDCSFFVSLAGVVRVHTRHVQDPADKRVILCDDKLKAVFGCDSVGMFAMNKHYSRHIGV
jgi:chromatin remodeling complex protein RSC6